MSAPLWTSQDILDATGGRVIGPAFAADGLSIDTRTLQSGDLFVALAGERDGHEFLGQAFAAGAAGALTAREAAGPCIVVEDTLAALGRLALAARVRAPAARRGAVTGSVGKTGVTQAVLAGLRLAGPAHGSVQSYNNHIGVPLTLARMPPETERAVFEIGMNHAGEIAPLTRLVAPQAAAVTTVGAVHTENFSDGEAGVAAAKAEIFEGLETGGIAVLDADSTWRAFLTEKARDNGARVRTFGTAADADARLTAFRADEGGAVVEAVVDGAPISFRIAQSARHWGPMSLCVLMMLDALETPRGAALAALADFAPLPGRGAERRLAIAGAEFTLVDDSYNANPISVRAALLALASRAGARRKLAVLTDMLELGGDAEAAHAGLAGEIEDAGVDLVFAAGPLMESLFEALPARRRGAWAPCAGALSPHLVDAIRSGDVVMVKGSKGSKAWAVVEAVAKAAGEGAG